MAKTKTTEQFIKEVKIIHGNKYDYSKVNYVGSNTKVCIICPKHGEFSQTPSNHLRGQGCPICRYISSGEKNKTTTEQFIKEAKIIHGNKYDYSKVNYINSHTKVCIICPEHGEFKMLPYNHIKGHGCQKCVGKNKTTEDFIEEASLKHNNKYSYEKTVYNGALKKLIITCPQHGDFLQTAHDHLTGRGCPICKQSKIENDVTLILKKNNIKFESQKNFDWLFYKKQLYLDFYLPDYNIAIECQGEQHYKNVKYFGGESGLIQRVKRDNRKKELCEQNGIKIVYIDWNEKDIEKIIKNLL